MKLEIFGKNYEPSDLLKSVTEKKCEKLARRFSDDDDAQVRFNVVFENGVYTTNLIVTSRGQTYRAEAQSTSPFDNLDVVIPKLLGQMKKQKDVWERSKKGAPAVYADMRVSEEEE